jgi:hypothetical protein
LQVDELLVEADVLFKRARGIKARAGRFGVALQEKLLTTLRRSQLSELLAINARIERDAKELEPRVVEQNNYADWFYRTTEGIYKPPTEKVIVVLRQETPGLCTIDVVTIDSGDPTAHYLWLARGWKRPGYLLEIGLFRDLVQDAERSIALTSDQDRLCLSAERLIYQRVLEQPGHYR